MTEDEDSTTSLGNLCQCSVNVMIKSIFSSCSEETSCVGLKKTHLSSFKEWCLALSFRCAWCSGCLGSWPMAKPGHHHQRSCSPYLELWNCALPGKILCPSVTLSSELPLPTFPWILPPHLSAEWHRVITKGCGTYRIEKSQILTQWRNQGELRLSSGQQTALYGYYKAAGNEWPGEKRHTVRIDKRKKVREREGVEEKKERERHTTFKQKQKECVT